MKGAGRDVIVRRLVDDDVERYLELRDVSFGYPGGDDIRAEIAGRMATTWGAFRGDALAASLADPRFEVYVAGVRVPMAGVAAVQTAPEHRRLGLAARLLRHALEIARDDGIGWSLLYPFDPRFYTRYGWQGLSTGVTLEMPLERLAGGALADATRVTSDLRGAFQALYARCAVGWTFANARTIGPWDVWEDLLAEPGQQGLAYRLDDAYVVLQHHYEDDQHGPVLRVRDHAHASASGRRALLALLASFAGQSSKIVIDVPATDPLAWDWSGWYAKHARKTLMARVADVPSAIARLRARTSTGERIDLDPCTVTIRDAFAPWNEGSWRVTPGPDRCVVARSDRAITTLDVRGLALLLSGAVTPRTVILAGLAEGDHAALDTLATLAAGRTPYQAPVDAF
ncbi:MAG: GNAT family N-acetyltransferase [Trueperaceae bacterium]|nr:GNAT family N-acetyltransferase [Trueperaceae bacterium]